MTNKLMSETLSTPAVIAPANQAAGAVNTPNLLMDKTRKFLFTVIAGAIAATLDFKVQASVDGVVFVDVPGAAIVTMTATGAAQLELRADRLNAINPGPFYRGVLTAGAGGAYSAVLVQGGDTRWLLASDYNLASMPPAVVI